EVVNILTNAKTGGWDVFPDDECRYADHVALHICIRLELIGSQAVEICTKNRNQIKRADINQSGVAHLKNDNRTKKKIGVTLKDEISAQKVKQSAIDEQQKQD